MKRLLNPNFISERRSNGTPLLRHVLKILNIVLKHYSIVIALFGQASSHAPQSRHSFSSTTAISLSLREIAAAGHSSTQVPQPVQESALTFATIFSLLFVSKGYYIYLEIYKIALIREKNFIKRFRFFCETKKKEIKEKWDRYLQKYLRMPFKKEVS